MINPIRLCNNLFEDEKFSDASLRSFSEDHSVRLAQPENNPGSIYSTLLTDTTAKYNAYYGKMTSQAVKEAIAEGATITRNNARHDAEEKIRSLEALTIFKFGEASAQYQELFPLGFTEYVHAREGDIGRHFDRFVEAATTHLDADFHTEVVAIEGLVDAFHLAFTARETIVSQVDISITGKNSDRIALTTQLTKNFLIIASNNIGNPDKFDDYYDPRFLPLTSDSGSTVTFPFEITGSLNANVATTYNLNQIDVNANPTLSFLLESMGPSIIRFYATDSPTGLPGAGAVIDVTFGTGVSKTIAQLIAELGLNDTKHYLGIMNIGATPSGYKVTISV